MPEEATAEPMDYMWITRGMPLDLTLKLRDRSGASTFVETGTFRGGTTRWAGENFKKVFTIEAEPGLHAAAAEAGAAQTNVNYLLGDSATVLPDLVAKLEGPTIFWLDGHYSGGTTAGENAECPVIEELAAIARSPHEHCVLIDDARFFLSTPPLGHRKEDWPPIAEVLDAISKLPGNLHTVVLMDVIIAVPEKLRELLERWCQERNLAAWEHLVEQAKAQPRLLGRILNRLNR